MERLNYDPIFWGPIVWKTMFIFALNYPLTKVNSTTRDQYKIFFTSLQNMLPCEKCRQGYTLFLKTNPIDNNLERCHDLLSWVVKMYNNKRPLERQIHNLKGIKKLIKPDESILQVIKTLKKQYPNLKFN